MIKIWVILKTLFAKIIGYIDSVKKEKEFMLYKSDIQIHDLEKKYQIDNIAGIPFDFAYDSITIFNRKNVDCGMNRAWQMYFNIKKYNAYLVHYTHYPLKEFNNTRFNRILNKLGILMAHITVIIEKDHKWYTADYGQVKMANDPKQAIEMIASKYKCKVKSFVIQDINWKIRKLKEIE